MPIACGVDSHPPPPPRGGASAASTGGTSGTSGSGGARASASASESASTSGGGSAGPDSVCACAAAAFAPASQCATCFRQVGAVDCAAFVNACLADDACIALLPALVSCDADAGCIADTLATHPGRNAYLDVLACVCVSCASSCVPARSVPCDAGKIPDAATDAPADTDANDGS